MFRIMNISRLRIKIDGEGIRTLIITEGCPLRCRYCFNKGTWDGTKHGRQMTASQLYEEIFLDRPYFMATRGGVTFGGGEPLLYIDQINEFRTLCRNEFSVFAETSLYVSKTAVLTAASCIDHFIVDIKSADPAVYKAYTGGELAVAIDNLKLLISEIGSEKIEVRVPIIPGMTTDVDQQSSVSILKKLGITRFDLFTYSC